MRRLKTTPLLIAAAVIAFAAAAPAFADKPSWAGEGRPDKHEKKDKSHQKERRDDDRQRNGNRHESRSRDDGRVDIRFRFDDRHRVVVHDYYDHEFRAGKCPPGLAKKHNGCLPPGQAKKWSRGRSLPRDVVYYDLPSAVVVKLGKPPAGHKYVRVATDILLIAVGTSMVVDAIEDLGRM